VRHARLKVSGGRELGRVSCLFVHRQRLAAAIRGLVLQRQLRGSVAPAAVVAGAGLVLASSSPV